MSCNKSSGSDNNRTTSIMIQLLPTKNILFQYFTFLYNNYLNDHYYVSNDRLFSLFVWLVYTYRWAASRHAEERQRIDDEHCWPLVEAPPGGSRFVLFVVFCYWHVQSTTLCISIRFLVCCTHYCLNLKEKIHTTDYIIQKKMSIPYNSIFLSVYCASTA